MKHEVIEAPPKRDTLTGYMEANGVLRIARLDTGFYSVYAKGNRFGVGQTVREALDSAGVTA